MRIARGARGSIIAVATVLALGAVGCEKSDVQRGADDAGEQAGQDAKQAGQDAKDKAEKRADEAARDIEK
jgi:hypothetical protein